MEFVAFGVASSPFQIQNSKNRGFGLTLVLDKRRLRSCSYHVSNGLAREWRKSTIPYAFSPPNDVIDKETGAFLKGPSRHGLMGMR